MSLRVHELHVYIFSDLYIFVTGHRQLGITQKFVAARNWAKKFIYWTECCWFKVRMGIIGM